MRHAARICAQYCPYLFLHGEPERGEDLFHVTVHNVVSSRELQPETIAALLLLLVVVLLLLFILLVVTAAGRQGQRSVRELVADLRHQEGDGGELGAGPQQSRRYAAKHGRGWR